MSDKIPVTYIGPFDEVEVASTGLVVKRGETVDLYPTIAGRPPSDDDLGAGLLAQVDAWTTTSKKPPKGAPAKNAGREAWEAFYVSEGVDAAEIADLGRDELVALYESHTEET